MRPRFVHINTRKNRASVLLANGSYNCLRLLSHLGYVCMLFWKPRKMTAEEAEREKLTGLPGSFRKHLISSYFAFSSSFSSCTGCQLRTFYWNYHSDFTSFSYETVQMVRNRRLELFQRNHNSHINRYTVMGEPNTGEWTHQLIGVELQQAK